MRCGQRGDIFNQVVSEDLFWATFLQRSGKKRELEREKTRNRKRTRAVRRRPGEVVGLAPGWEGSCVPVAGLPAKTPPPGSLCAEGSAPQAFSIMYHIPSLYSTILIAD